MRLFNTWMLVTLVCVLSGCGGDDTGSEEPSSADSTSSANAPAPPDLAAIRPPVAPAGNAAAKPPGAAAAPGAALPPGLALPPGVSLPDGMLGQLAQAANAARAGAAKQPNAPALSDKSAVPENVSKWSDEQIETAVREGDDRAAEAIDARVEKSTDDDELVEFLNRMLKATLPADENAVQEQSLRQSAGNRIITHLDRTMAAGKPSSFRLARQPSRNQEKEQEKALQAAEEIMRRQGITPPAGVRGLLPGGLLPGGLGRGAAFPGATRPQRRGGQNPDDDRKLLTSIVQGLVKNGSDAAWSTLLNIVTEQQRTVLPLEDSTAVVFESVFGSEDVNADATEKFAISVVSDKSTPRPAMELLTSLSHEVARSALHLPDEMPEMTEPNNTLNGFSGFGSGGLLGRPGSGQRPNDSPPLPKLNLENGKQETLNALRSAAFLDAVQERVAAGSDLTADSAALIGLASTLPDVGIRQATFARFAAGHADGATSLMDGGVYRDFSRDPGHLAVLKALPQVDIDRVGAANIDPNGPEASWVKATWEVVRTLRDQLNEASSDQSLAWDGRHPIRLHRGAEPEVSIHLVIPDGSNSTADQPDDAAADANPDPNKDPSSDKDDDSVTAGTHVYYTRCRITPEKPSDRKKVSDHYTSRTRGVRRELADQGVVWFDGGRRSQNGTRTTLDVLIEQVKAPGNAAGGFGAPGGARAGGGAVSYTVEAIAVVVQDPAIGEKSDAESDADAAAREDSEATAE